MLYFYCKTVNCFLFFIIINCIIIAALVANKVSSSNGYRLSRFLSSSPVTSTFVLKELTTRHHVTSPMFLLRLVWNNMFIPGHIDWVAHSTLSSHPTSNLFHPLKLTRLDSPSTIFWNGHWTSKEIHKWILLQCGVRSRTLMFTVSDLNHAHLSAVLLISPSTTQSR